VTAKERHLFVLNTGSSSVKAASFRLDAKSLRRYVTVAVSGIGGRATVRITRGSGEQTQERRFIPDHDAGLRLVLAVLRPGEDPPPDAVGHRIVHGGPNHAGPALVDDALLRTLNDLVPFAPLHLPAGLHGITLVAAELGNVPQVACFDTAFHRQMPLTAQRLPLPARLWDDGVRRYGFHGLSYEHIVDKLGADRLGRAVLAHLGAGASLAAVLDGRSVDTTMSFTPASGIMMATRSGDLDPGVLIYLLDRGHNARQLERLVERESGLVGVSGTSGDMKELLGARDHDPAAALAVDLFCRDVSKQIGALAVVLGGIDTLVFTGGIGEHAAAVREAVCQPLTHLGIDLDPRRNERAAKVVSSAVSTCTVRIEPADEESVIARHTARLVLDHADARA
jgi:acetate kinase